jgi:hypothetical protein
VRVAVHLRCASVGYRLAGRMTVDGRELPIGAHVEQVVTGLR